MLQLPLFAPLSVAPAAPENLLDSAPNASPKLWLPKRNKFGSLKYVYLPDEMKAMKTWFYAQWQRRFPQPRSSTGPDGHQCPKNAPQPRSKRLPATSPGNFLVQLFHPNEVRQNGRGPRRSHASLP